MDGLMSARFAFVALAIVAVGCSSPECRMPGPGSCTQDSDCVLAQCMPLQGCDCGSPIAKSQLDAGSCLIEVGTVRPQWCPAPQGQPCQCPAAAARCDAGTC